MNLKNYITEAISSRGNSKQPFPDKADRDKIVEWLDGMDFHEVTNNGLAGSSELMDYWRSTGQKCYVLGLYSEVETAWIMIFDTVNIYFIRTMKKYEKLKSHDGNLILYNAELERCPEPVTFKELKKEIEKHA